MKESSARLSLITCILIIATLFILSQPTSSISSSAGINVVFEFEKVLQLSVSENEMLIEDLTPGTSDNTNEITVNVATNSETGFVMDAAVGERLRPSTRIPNLRDNGDTYFSSVGLNTTVTEIPLGSWGYSIDHGASYSGLPDYRDVHPSDIFLETTDSSNVSIPFLVGATAADDQKRGIYYTSITFRAVVRPAVPTIDTILYMQELDETVYASMKKEKQYQLMDKRDGKMYFISRLNDGNVWMTQNLDFDLYDGIVLDPETTDVERETVMDLTELGKNSVSSDHYYYYDNYMFDAGEYYCPNGYCNNPTSPASLDELEPTDESYHYALGNRYSFSAATADYFGQCPKSDIDYSGYNACITRYNDTNNIDSETSICPKGWTLPSNNRNGEHTSVYDFGMALGMPSTYSSFDTAVTNAPAYLVGNGYAYASESYFEDYTNKGSNYAYLWTSTNSGQYYGYILYAYPYVSSYSDGSGNYVYYAYSGYFSAGGNTYGKYYLFPIRCVAKAPQFTVEYYFNDGTATTPFNTWKSKAAWSGNNKVTPGIPERVGYKFLGWGTSPTTVEARYLPNTEITLDQYETKLYAVWEEISEDDQEEGVYTFAAVLRRAGKVAVDGHYNLQDLTSELCEQVTMGSTTTLRDARDGKLYKVGKLQISNDGAYGTCWMLNDLRLGSKTDSYTLTPEDSDVQEEVTIPAIPTYQYDGSSAFYTGYMMDNDEHTDPKGRQMGYLYNYNLITAGYYGEHYNNGQQTTPSSICPKNWKLPTYYSSKLINSGKKITDNIEPYNYTSTYYYSYDNNGKHQNILKQFYGYDAFIYRSGSNNLVFNSSTSSNYATNMFYGSSVYYDSYGSGTISYDNSNDGGYASFLVRCMIPVDYEMTTFTISYNVGYNSPYSIPQQTITAKTTDPEFKIVIDPKEVHSRPGFELLGWSEFSGATVPDYYNGDTTEYPLTQTSLSLYGVWRRIQGTNAVTFDDAFEAAGKTKHGNYYSMQDMTPEICDAVTDGQQGRLVDVRDNKVYWVGRFTSVQDMEHPGECWMTQNLNFEITMSETGTLLSPETSDVIDPTVTHADIMDTDHAYYGYMDASDYYFPYGGLVYSDPSSSQYDQLNALASVSELSQDDERWHYALGSFYAWTTATGTGHIRTVTNAYRLRDKETSICPKGWKIPHYDYNSPTQRSFNSLSYYILPSMNYGYNNYYFADPFYPVATGFITPTNDTDDFYTVISSHRMNSFGSSAYFWTANVSSERNPYSWYFYKNSYGGDYDKYDLKNSYSGGNSYSSYYNYHLFPIRCVARPE